MPTESLGKRMMGIILAVVMAGIFLGYLLPVGLDAYHAANTSSWEAEEVAIYGVLGIFLVLTPLIVLARGAMEA